LARIVHRRVIRRVDGSVGAPVEELDAVPPPMEARLEAAVGRVTERLSWVGWLSLIATVAYVLANAMPMFHLGPIVAAIDRNSGDLIRLAAGAATLVLPAALELGGSGARTAVPWLMRGAILSALVMVANVVDDGLRDWVIRNLVDLNADPPIGLNDLTQPVSLALTAVGFVPAIFTITGASCLIIGLARAGARPDRVILGVLLAVALALTAFGAALTVVLAPFGIEPGTLARLAVSIAVTLVTTALSTALAVHLLAGARRLRPRSAWRLAAIAGVCQLVLTIGSGANLITAYLTRDIELWNALSFPIFIVGSLGWICLALAFALGLGRPEEDVAEPTRRLVARWVRRAAT
jgi:hypothetical protein